MSKAIPNLLLVGAWILWIQMAGAESSHRVPAQPPDLDAGIIEVVVDDGTFSVRAEQAPFDQVLVRLGAEAGFPIEMPEGYADSGRVVSIDLDGVTWRDGLPELLRGWNYSLVMAPSASRPEALFVIAESPAEPTGHTIPTVAEDDQDAPSAKPPETGLQAATRIANEMLERNEDPVGVALRTVKAAAAGDRDGNVYAEALRALRGLRDPRIMPVLLPALDSNDSRARSAALEVMRDAPGTIEAPTLDRIHAMAAEDTDPQVRRDALEVYVRYGDQEEVLSVVEAMARKAGPVRDIAVREWIRIEQERLEAEDAVRQVREAGAE